MNLVTLNAGTLQNLKTLINFPGQALPAALKTLAPNGQWELLVQKVGSNLAKTGAAKLTLPLLDQSTVNDAALSSKWTWSASIGANAALSLDLLTEQDLAQLPIAPDKGHTLIVYGANIAASGKLGVNAKKLPWGSVGVAADRKGSAIVRWYIQAKDDEPLLSALETAGHHFVWPHDVQSMLRLCNRTDWFGLEYELNGEAQLAIDVIAAKTAVGWTVNLDGPEASVGLSLGLNAGFKASHASRWKISAMVEARTVPGHAETLGLRVKLHDLKQSDRKLSFDLVAGADFSPIVTNAEHLLRAAWPELPDSALLDALTQPGTAIAKHVRTLIEDKLDGPLESVVGLLVGGKATEALRDSLVEKLTASLTDTLDNALSDIASGKAKVEDLATRWLTQVLGKSADLVTKDGDLAKLVDNAVSEATKGLSDALGSLSKFIVGKGSTEVDKVLKSLGELGAQFDAITAQLDANAASSAIKKAIDRYAALRTRLLEAMGDGQRQKVVLTLSSVASTSKTTEAAFEVWLRADDNITAEAEQLFHMLCAGQLLALPELVQAGLASGALADATGWLLSTGAALSEQRATLNFFGISISSSSSWLSKVAVRADLVTGDLIAVKAEAGVETAIANPWKNRTANLRVQLEFLSSPTAPRRLAASLDGAFTTKQENTDRAKVQDLLNTYADAVGMQRNDIGLLLGAPPASDADGARRFWKSLTIAVPVALSVQQWAAFAARQPDDIDKVSLEIALAQFRRRYAQDSLFFSDPLASLRDDAENADESTILGFLKRFPTRYVTRYDAAYEAGKLGIETTESVLFSPGARRFMAYQRLSATVQAPLRLRNLAIEAANQLQAIPAQSNPEAARQMLEPIMRRMQEALAPVALVSETWLGIGLLGAKDEPIAWPFVSFITTMAKLTDLAVPPGFVPIAQVGDQAAIPLIIAA